MKITYYQTPHKNMPHIFDKVSAPVVALMQFAETPPSASEIAAAQNRIPEKPKLFGNQFSKKAEDIFGLFIDNPLFVMYKNQMFFDIKGTSVGAEALPLRSADDVLEKLNKRIPYVNAQVERKSVQSFIDIMTAAIKEMNLHFFKIAQPKATYNCYTTTECEVVILGNSLVRVANKEYIIVNTVVEAGKGSVYLCYQFDFTFYAVQVGKAYVPLRLFPLFTVENGVENTARKQDRGELRRLVDKLAHFMSFSMDRSEETQMADALILAGNDALDEIMSYLLSCAQGAQTEYWWNDAAALVKLIRKFPGVDHENKLKTLMNRQSNIWEYQTQIHDVAQQELLNLKKTDSAFMDKAGVSAEDAEAELKFLYNGVFDVEERLKKTIEIRGSVDGWSDDMKAFYYYIIGDALRRRNPDDERQYPFYAAQVFHAPQGTSLGWHELLKLEKYKQLTPTYENAKMLHETLPLPSFDELLKAIK